MQKKKYIHMFNSGEMFYVMACTYITPSTKEFVKGEMNWAQVTCPDCIKMKEKMLNKKSEKRKT